MEIGGWLRERRKIRIMELLLEHSRRTVEVVEECGRMIEYSLTKDDEKLRKSFERQEQMEREADYVRRRIMEELAKGELPPEEREFMMRLSRQLDYVADYAHGVGRILNFLPLSKFDEELQNEIREMRDKVNECANNLDKVFRCISENRLKEALEYADKVERLEEEVDTLHMETRITLMKDKYANMDCRLITFIIDFLEALEDTSDRCEDTCDQARVVIVRLLQPKS
ncbi:MAG TPA: DUF47 family protein [Candidatus Bathyarchaeota archaeon]|nr:DUF47 family protein [Candidatus Bathyarchaeota archaeon]